MKSKGLELMGFLVVFLTAAGLSLVSIGYGLYLRFYKYPLLDWPLLLAVHNGNAAEVGALLQRGANPKVQGRDGATAMQVALVAGREDIAQMLWDAGAKR